MAVAWPCTPPKCAQSSSPRDRETAAYISLSPRNLHTCALHSFQSFSRHIQPLRCTQLVRWSAWRQPQSHFCNTICRSAMQVNEVIVTKMQSYDACRFVLLLSDYYNDEGRRTWKLSWGILSYGTLGVLAFRHTPLDSTLFNSDRRSCRLSHQWGMTFEHFISRLSELLLPFALTEMVV